MKTLFVGFWTAMIFLSIAWYFVLLFYVGFKGGVEIIQMVRTLSGRPAGKAEEIGANATEQAN